MTLHSIVWRASNACAFTVVDEVEPYNITATPVVTTFRYGVTVGMYSHGPFSFGHWYSSNTCGLIDAWRITQILPRVKTMRNQNFGCDSTMCGLVIALQGDRQENRMKSRAEDLGMTVDELDAELRRLGKLWPSIRELCSMWDALRAEQQEMYAFTLRTAIDSHEILASQELIGRIELAELRLRTVAQQKEHEQEQIDKGLEPEVSLHQFMLDIGVVNLVYAVGYGETFEPTHYDFDSLDREVMRELIGDYGYSDHVALITTAKQPDDSSAFHSAGGIGISMHWTDFGERGHPRIQVGGVGNELVSARWDRVTERFVLTVRPLGLSQRDCSQDTEQSILSLREMIGEPGEPLKAGQRAPWCDVIDRRTRRENFFRNLLR